MENNIAIVIPAYKRTYLRETLLSLTQQSFKGFNVYIGDDNSPENLYEIVHEFSEHLHLFYTKFDENKGGVDLVSQWDRCVDLIQREEWFILFSDDDLLDEDCMWQLNQALIKPDFDVYHFDIRFIDADSNVVHTPAKYPAVISSVGFFNQLYSGKIEARMPEFIFRTSHFKSSGGFIPFEMAMRSDNATVIKCAFDKGIATISGGMVSWRKSGLNMSAGGASKEKHQSFYRSLILFFEWLDDFCEQNKVVHPWGRTKRLNYLFNYGYNMRNSIGSRFFTEQLRNYEGFPKNIGFVLACFNIFLFKLKNKFIKKY